tara:strand:+ start:318 stop:836 length:519 start_codon:yes stop_codon:yes gene_type:complete
LNIFAIEKDNRNNIDWIGSAYSQDNYRVVKMILESCQMLSTALNELSDAEIAPYKTTHKNHPSNIWVRESSDNFENLSIHTLALLEEYTSRFNKTHKCSAVLEQILESYQPELFPSREPTPLPLCMPAEFQGSCTVDSYRRFYASKDKIRYPKGKVPNWFEKYRGDKPYTVI